MGRGRTRITKERDGLVNKYIDIRAVKITQHQNYEWPVVASSSSKIVSIASSCLKESA